VTSLVRLKGVLSPGALPQDVAVAQEDGRLVAPDDRELQAAMIASPTGVSIVGERIAELPASFEQPGMALWRVEQPLRLSHRIAGLRPNGDLHAGEKATIRVFSCGPGALELTLLGKEGLPTRVLLEGDVKAERAIPAETVWRVRVPSPPSADGSGTCLYRLESDGLVGSTRIEFVREPAAVG
jgi:hypothetical protein